MIGTVREKGAALSEFASSITGENSTDMDLAEVEPIEANQSEEMPAGDLASGGLAGAKGLLLEPKGRYLVYPERPLEMYNSPTAPAYQAVMRADPSRPLMALLCDATLPPRVDVMDALRGFNLPGMLKIVDWGMVYWEPEKRRRFMVIVERPDGGRVMPSLDATQPPLSEDDIVRGLLSPLLSTLKEFAIRGVAHRGIRPNNLFFTDGARRTMVLGEGVTAPPAYDQPAIFEPIESAMAASIGRGNGSPGNDLYSLGVTILFLLLGRSPNVEKDPEKLIENKIEVGSYAALVGQYRVPLGLMEALRGMLSDDLKERWTITDLDMWLSGRRLSPKQPKLPQRASRPFNFNGADYFNARSLATAFAKHYVEAAAVIRSKNLDSWLRRSLGDEARAAALEATVMSTASHITSGRGGDDRLVARACVALDPAAPIRYRGFGVAIDGIGPALAAAMGDQTKRQMVSEVIASRLPIHWIAQQVKPRAEDLRAVQMLEKLPSIIEQTAVGMGVERCLYDLNPSERCHSPIFERDVVVEIAELIPALEAIAERPDRGELYIDRHMAAFIASRSRRPNENLIRVVGSNHPEARGLAILRLLASVQEATQSQPAPALSNWLITVLGPAISSFHQRKRRDRVADRLQKAALSGNLNDLVVVLDDENERRADAADFATALAEYREIRARANDFDAEVTRRAEEAQVLGEQIAAAIAGTLVSVSIAVTLFIMFI
jgi:hypothetical protein